MDGGEGIVSVVWGRIRSFSLADSLRIYIQRLKRFEKKRSSSLKILGIVAFVLGLLQLVVGVYAFLSGEPSIPFLAPSPFFILIGGFLFLRYAPSQLSASLGVLLIS